MCGLFDEDPAGVWIAAFADAATFLSGATGVFGRDEAEEGHEFFGVLEAAEGADFGDGDHGGNEFEPFEAHESIDEGLALPVLEEIEHGIFKGFDTLGVEVDGGEVVFEDDVVCGVGEGEVTEVAFVGFGPVGFAGVVEAESSKHGEEPGFGSSEVIDGVGAGAAKVADGFVNRVGDVDGDEVIGAKHFGKFGGVTFVGFDPVTGFDGNEGGCDDVASNAHLKETSGNPEAASAGFIADVEIGELEVMTFGNAANGSFESVLGSGNGAVMLGEGLAVGFEGGDDGFCFMDVESEVECLWCV